MKKLKFLTLEQRSRRKWIKKHLLIIAMLSIYFIGGFVLGLFKREDFNLTFENKFTVEDAYKTLEYANLVNPLYYQGISSIYFTEEYGKFSTRTSSGAYDPVLNRIVIFRSYPSTFLHEIGHHIYAEFLTKKQKKDWNLMSDTSQYFVSDYAKESVREDAKYSEDFAESFDYFIRNQDEIYKCSRNIPCLRTLSFNDGIFIADVFYGLEADKMIYFVDNIEKRREK